MWRDCRGAEPAQQISGDAPSRDGGPARIVFTDSARTADGLRALRVGHAHLVRVPPVFRARVWTAFAFRGTGRLCATNPRAFRWTGAQSACAPERFRRGDAVSVQGRAR